jgi:predicted CxxxxCH...CXXCH cytochrome family protein
MEGGGVEETNAKESSVPVWPQGCRANSELERAETCRARICHSSCQSLRPSVTGGPSLDAEDWTKTQAGGAMQERLKAGTMQREVRDQGGSFGAREEEE